LEGRLQRAMGRGKADVNAAWAYRRIDSRETGTVRDRVKNLTGGASIAPAFPLRGVLRYDRDSDAAADRQVSHRRPRGPRLQTIKTLVVEREASGRER
jgi:hypothetical protein